jgi:hypothetical protein
MVVGGIAAYRSALKDVEDGNYNTIAFDRDIASFNDAAKSCQ